MQTLKAKAQPAPTLATLAEELSGGAGFVDPQEVGQLLLETLKASLEETENPFEDLISSLSALTALDETFKKHGEPIKAARREGCHLFAQQFATKVIAAELDPAQRNKVIELCLRLPEKMHGTLGLNCIAEATRLAAVSLIHVGCALLCRTQLKIFNGKSMICAALTMLINHITAHQEQWNVVLASNKVVLVVLLDALQNAQEALRDKAQRDLFPNLLEKLRKFSTTLKKFE